MIDNQKIYHREVIDMSCAHEIDPVLVSKRFYFSRGVTKAWENVFAGDLTSHYFICLICQQQCPTEKEQKEHFKTHEHSIYYDLISTKIFCEKCHKWLRSPQSLTDVCLLSIPLTGPKEITSGFPNLANSCYSSAILAALSLCEPIVTAARYSTVPICRVFAAAALKDHKMNTVIHALMPQFSPKRQEDAAEFLLYFLDKCCKDPHMRSLFGGSTTTRKCCKSCGEKTTSEQPFTILPIPLNEKGWVNYETDFEVNEDMKPRSFGKDDVWREIGEDKITTATAFVSFMQHGSTAPYSLQKCMEAMFIPSTTECDKCHKEADFNVALTGLPEVFILQLARFGKRWFGLGKMHQFILFPAGSDIDFGHFVPSIINCGPTAYRLSSIVAHTGFMSTGHYTCYAVRDGEWFHFDDSTMRKVSDDEALSSQAYILFYVRNRQGSLSAVDEMLKETPPDFGIPLKLIADPQKWINTIPKNEEFSDVISKASTVAGGNVAREPIADDLRKKFLLMFPELESANLSEDIADVLWNFLFEKGPPPPDEIIQTVLSGSLNPIIQK